jgi:hypothetical protein
MQRFGFSVKGEKLHGGLVSEASANIEANWNSPSLRKQAYAINLQRQRVWLWSRGWKA